MSEAKNKKIILLIIAVITLTTILATIFIQLSTAKENLNNIIDIEIGKEFICEYLNAKYQNVDKDNFESRIDSLEMYYTNNMQYENNWNTSDSSKEYLVEIFMNENITTSILAISVEKNDTQINTYTANVSILYSPEIIENAYCYEYEMLFTLEKEKEDVKIKDISVSDTILYYIEIDCDGNHEDHDH